MTRKRKVDRAEEVARKLVRVRELQKSQFYDVYMVGWTLRTSGDKSLAHMTRDRIRSDLAAALRKAGIR